MKSLYDFIDDEILKIIDRNDYLIIRRWIIENCNSKNLINIILIIHKIVQKSLMM